MYGSSSSHHRLGKLSRRTTRAVRGRRDLGSSSQEPVIILHGDLLSFSASTIASCRPSPSSNTPDLRLLSPSPPVSPDSISPADIIINPNNIQPFICLFFLLLLLLLQEQKHDAVHNSSIHQSRNCLYTCSLFFFTFISWGFRIA